MINKLIYGLMLSAPRQEGTTKEEEDAICSSLW